MKQLAVSWKMLNGVMGTGFTVLNSLCLKSVIIKSLLNIFIVEPESQKIPHHPTIWGSTVGPIRTQAGPGCYWTLPCDGKCDFLLIFYLPWLLNGRKAGKRYLMSLRNAPLCLEAVGKPLCLPALERAGALIRW